MNALKIAGIGFLALSVSACKINDTLTGYVATTMCTKVFLSGLPEDHILETDLIPATFGLMKFTKVNVNYAEKSVTATAENLYAKSIYRENLGCTLVGSVSEAELRQQSVTAVPPASLPADQPWPHGSSGVSGVEGVDLQRIATAADPLFQENLSFAQNTSSVLVAYRGHLIYERYAPHYSAQTPVGLFSVSKTIAAVLAGMAQEEGKIDMNAPADVPEWKFFLDPRHAITPYQLLSMTSGMGNPLTSQQIDPDTFELLKADNMAHTFAIKGLFATPGTDWHYNTGNTLVFSRMLQQKLGGLNAYYRYMQTELFRKIQVNSAVVQADNSGNLALGMFTFMNPRDLLRFGQLLENGGVWNGEQIFPAQWLATMLQAVPMSNPWNVDYGVGIFPNTEVSGHKFWPALPSDAMTLLGYRGQVMVVVPSLDLVMLRTGDAQSEDLFIPELAKFVQQVPDALPN